MEFLLNAVFVNDVLYTLYSSDELEAMSVVLIDLDRAVNARKADSKCAFTLQHITRFGGRLACT
jgi:hypothetical protein